MQMVFNFLAFAAGIYSILILIRILISWFGNYNDTMPVKLISRVTDPYLDWWRRSVNIRIGVMDFSAVAAIVSLSLLQNIFFSLAHSQKITIGYLLAIFLTAVWSIASFILGFLFLVILLRLIAYLTNRNIYSPFWKVIDTISQPVLYRLNRIFFGNRIAGYVKGIVISLAALAAIRICGGFVIPLIAEFFLRLPF